MSPTRMMMSRAPVAFLILVCTGCNVDRFWQSDKEVRHAPVERNWWAEAPSSVDVSVTEREEVDLVEELIARRHAYHASLLQLRDYYQQRGRADKLAWAEYELKGVRNTKPFRYLMDAEVAAADLRPTRRIPEADRMYVQGIELMKEGGHGVPGFYREDIMLHAARVFRDLVVKYPGSDKIDDAAFQLGEIHKEYLPDQETIAIKWYERAWTWDPATPHPARFQAAVVSDYRLHDRDRALELYQDVVDHETGILSNVRFAMRRIYELSGQGAQASAVPRP